MSYYKPEQVTRSRDVLDEIVGLVPDSTLIGGWGTWVRLRGHMSHDIDMVVTHQDLDLLRSVVDDLSRSGHLSAVKYRGTYQSIHLDLYVPHQSVLGQRLGLRVEHLVEHTGRIDGYRVLDLETHLTTKLAALLDRPDSLPGEKDRYEIIGLLRQGADVARVGSIATEASSTPERVPDLLGEAFDLLDEYRPLASEGTWGKKDRRWLAGLRRKLNS